MVLVLERIDSLATLESDAAWWQIYEDAFPPPFQVPRADLLRVFQHPMVRFYRGRIDGQTVSMITTQLLIDPASVFVGYFAVGEGARGHGTGTSMLDELIRLGHAELARLGHRPLGTVLETELGHNGAPMSHSESWFSKHGFRRMPFGYRQPPIGGYPAVPMHLLFKPASDSLALTPQLQLGVVRSLFEQKYAKSYGITPQQIAEELRRCAADLGLGSGRPDVDPGRPLPKTS